MSDVTDETFERDVIERSRQVPVVVDLWAPWCGPCKALGPLLEQAVAATKGGVELAKVNVDENPQAARTFNVQSIPAVFALRDGAVVDGFVGAVPKAQVDDFVAKLAPQASEADRLAAAGDEASLRRALELDAGHSGAVTALARLLLARGDADGASDLLGRVPETADTRALAAEARLHSKQIDLGDDVTGLLDALLDRVREDEAARQEYVDVLEALGPEDPRTSRYRRALAARLF